MSIRRWFTIIEVMIVMMIIGILFLSFKSYFQVKDKNILYGQACIESIYGQVNNFMHAGLSSKSLYTWSKAIYPDQYIIFFDAVSQTIILKYIAAQESGYYSSIPITGNDIMYCSSKAYKISMTWDTYEITINKGLQENAALQFFYLSGTRADGTPNLGTWADDFFLCYPTGTGCKHIAHFELDTRTINLKKQICLGYTETGACYEWDN